MNTQQYHLTSEEFIAAIEQCAEQGDTFIRLNIVEAMPQSKNELEKIKRALDKMSNNYKDEINYQCVVVAFGEVVTVVLSVGEIFVFQRNRGFIFKIVRIKRSICDFDKIWFFFFESSSCVFFALATVKSAAQILGDFITHFEFYGLVLLAV